MAQLIAKILKSFIRMRKIDFVNPINTDNVITQLLCIEFKKATLNHVISAQGLQTAYH